MALPPEDGDDMKGRLWLAVGLCAFGLADACATDQFEIKPMTRHVLKHDGLVREYFVFLPSSYAGMQARPVAIFMHGYGGTATGTEAEVEQGLNFYAEKYGYIMVYPQSTWFMAGDSAETRWEVTSWNHLSGNFDTGPGGPICEKEYPGELCAPECGSCSKCAWTSCHDDIGFLEKLVAEVSADLHVDRNSIFVAGFSNGAMMANRIGCEASELFAAVALIGGRLERGYGCTPEKKLPLLQINGGQDRTVPYDGSLSSGQYYFASTTDISERWNEGESCAVERDAWSSPVTAGQAVHCTIACADTDHPSIDCVWPEGDHRWPGTPGFRGSNGYCVTELQSASMPEQLLCIAPDYTVDKWGSRLLFEFFDKHRGN
jgi:polyhydroxybutyrate depolymerase